jgi:hypothetical protein
MHGSIKMSRIASQTDDQGVTGFLSFYTSAHLGSDAVETVRIDGTGRLGVGTITPASALDVRWPGDGNKIDVLTIGNKNAILAESGESIVFRNFYRNARITAYSSPQVAFGGHLQIQTHGTANDGDSPADWNTGIVIDPTGKVGVGLAAPQTALHVQGNVRANGTIEAKYQDVAEWVPSRDKLQPGTVVIISANASNEVQSSMSGYDTAVAGVVSPRPGIALGEDAPGRVLVAQTGRVLVKVDAAYGAIRAGDLLVTSPTSGHAMRSEPLKVGGVALHRPGTVLGKALGALSKGKGEILVLLTLQ